MYKERHNRDIDAYTAEDALRDGLLIRVPARLRRQAGYRVPVRLTTGVVELFTAAETEAQGEDVYLERLWDTLYLARVAIANAERTAISARFHVTIGKKAVSLWACLDSTSGPAIHILTPQEY